MEIRNSIAVVTGAASGIACALSLDLARRGAKMLALVDMSERVEETAKSVRDAGSTIVQTFVGDTTDPVFRKATYDAIWDKYGPANICVPAAGITRDSIAVRMNKESGEPEIYPLETFRLVVLIAAGAAFAAALSAALTIRGGGAEASPLKTRALPTA